MWFPLSPNILWNYIKQEKIQCITGRWILREFSLKSTGNSFSHLLCNPFSALLIHISCSWVQSLLHYTSLWKPTENMTCKKKRDETLGTPKRQMNEHSQLSHLAHSGWFDTVSLMRLLVTSMMWTLSWWTWTRKRGFCYSAQCLRTCDILSKNRNHYHSGEQQSHEEGPWDQDEDD